METLETYTHKGYAINIHHDSDTSDPYDCMDGLYPMIVEGGRNYGHHDYHNLEDQLMGGLRTLGRVRLARLADALDPELHREASGYRGHERTEALREAIRDHISDQTQGDRLEALAALADELSWPCLSTCSRGYSQGDYVDVLVCWTPQFEAVTGKHPDSATPDSLRADVDLWSAWAWGDVYGYTIDGLEDSCWGFYGADYEKSGLIEDAKAVIDHHIAATTKTHLKRLKAWIKGRAPLTIREAAPSYAR